MLSHPATLEAVKAVKGRWDYLVGFTNGWQPVVQSIESQAPHILIAGPTKTGKSQLVKVILWQLLTKYQGNDPARIFVLDVKGYSHLDFEGRPNVTYSRKIPEIARALTDIIALAHSRGDDALVAARAGHDPGFAPVFVVLEDASAIVPKLPDQAREAWDDILSLGRGVSVHAIAMPQRPDMRYLGTGAVRDNLGNRILMSGHDDGARKMVAQGVAYETPALKRGRFVVLDGLVGIHTQGVLDDASIIESELDQLLGPRAQRSHDLGVSGNPGVDVVDGEPVLVDGASPSGLTEGEEPAMGRHGSVGHPLLTEQGRDTVEDDDEEGDKQDFHTPTISQTLYEGKGNMPPDQHIHAPGDPQVAPVGATPFFVSDTSLPLAARRPGAPPLAPAPINRSVDPQTHSPSPSRLPVPHVPVGGMGSGGGGSGGVGGPDPVTLREGYGRGVFGGVKYGTVETARKRARRERRWWVPVVATRPARGGMVAELYDVEELRRWWDSLPRSEANRPKDWLVYYIVPGGRGAVRVGADCKVGFTGDLDHRVGQLAERLEHVVKTERFRSRVDAKARETYLHDRYAAVRKSRDPNYEVFEIRGQLARDLADLLVIEERTA